MNWSPGKKGEAKNLFSIFAGAAKKSSKGKRPKGKRSNLKRHNIKRPKVKSHGLPKQMQVVQTMLCYVRLSWSGFLAYWEL